MKMRITVEGKAYEVEVELLDEPAASGGSTAATSSASPPLQLATPVWTPPRPGALLSDEKAGHE